MLILRRKIGQAIVIAGDIRVTILKIQGGQIKIGIEAPTSIPILRGELESLEPSVTQQTSLPSETQTSGVVETSTP